MAPRAIGALFALAAAILFVVSVASSAWWSGNPIIDGQTITAKAVDIGPLGGTGCNVGGDGSCESIQIDSTITLVGYGVLAAAGLAMLLSLLVARAALRISDARKALAGLSIVVTLIAAGGAGALVVLGPGIETSQQVEVPIGWGLFVFGGAIASSLLASLVTRKLEPEPLRLKPSMTPLPLPFKEVPVGLAETLPVPPLRGHEGPTIPASSPPPPTNFDEARTMPAPSRGEAPKLPATSVPPTRPRPPSAPQRPQSPSAPQPPSAPRPPSVPPRFDGARAKVLGAMPGLDEARPKPPSTPPPRPSAPDVPRSRPPSPPPVPRSKTGSARGNDESRPRNKTLPPRGTISTPPPLPQATPAPRPSAPALKRPGPTAPPNRGSKPIVPMPQKRQSQPTLSHAVPPMPASDNRAATEVENVTAVEIDAESKARAEANASAAQQRSITDMRTGPQDVGDITEIGEIPRMIGEHRTTEEDERSTQPVAVQDHTDQTRQPGELATTQDTPIPTLEAATVPRRASTASSSLPPPRQTDSMPSGPTPACPQCESPMTWVEEHLRFYCKECKMYF